MKFLRIHLAFVALIQYSVLGKICFLKRGILQILHVLDNVSQLVVQNKAFYPCFKLKIENMMFLSKNDQQTFIEI